MGSQGTAVLVQAGPEHCTQGTEPYALFEIRGLYSSSVQDDPKAVFRSWKLALFRTEKHCNTFRLFVLNIILSWGN